MVTNQFRRCVVSSSLAIIAMVLLNPLSAREDSPRPQQRPALTTSRVVGSPEPPLPYVTERAFPALKFNNVLDLVAAPGTDRLFVVEQSGKIFSFVDQPDVSKADLVVDLAAQIPGVRDSYALAFHPDFKRNRYCYICYLEAPDLPEGTHVSRFQVSDTNPPTIDVSTETPLITWRSGGHNGCCLKFGPDGYLYISTGDAGPANPPDIFKTGQDISDLLSSILRIDVDHADEGRNYRIPADNPFVGQPNARGEVWCYGLRNPWRMSFDQKTGDLWVGDVGWELWEMLFRIERGGNYGWAVMEGRQSTHPEWPRGPSPFLPPVIDHSHNESSSITEGLTYYGSRLKELQGVHIYSDYDTGKFWGFRYENGRVVDHRELADTTHRVVGFGEDHSGEFYILDHTAGTIHRLVPNPQEDLSKSFPRSLKETGLFTSVKEGKVASGVVAYSINAESWADYATAERWIAIPDQLAVTTTTTPWTYPLNTVLVKTLSLELKSGDPSSRKAIETQLLHFDGIEWMPYTYQWNDEQTDATLVAAAGAERVFTIVDSKGANDSEEGTTRQQTWRFAGRAECQRCHNRWSGPPLAFDIPQLNKADRDRSPSSQLQTLAAIGILDRTIPSEGQPELANPYDVNAGLDSRARAYLQVNCAHCHRMHAGGAVLSQMHYDLTLDKTNMLGVRPTQGTFGIHGAQVIAPGNPYRSVLYYRMSKLGGGRMPYIGSSEPDRAGIQLIHDWIEQLSPDLAPDQTGHEAALKQKQDDSEAINRLRQSSTATRETALVDQLLSTTGGTLMLLNAFDRHELPRELTPLVIERGTMHPDASVRDLFERFVSPDQRVKRLGSVIEPRQILSLTGDVHRGRQLFFETASVNCKNCHRIEKMGKEIGPELTTIGKKHSREQLLESLMEPSKRIDPKYVTYLAETADGRLVTGLLISRDDREVVLKDAQDQEIRLPVADVEQLVPQQQSLMPDLLLRDMTAQQVADLLEYLGSLK
ncbi:PQQ-dependent sugar dehydrogenase [Schlesneria sp.]|uniref:PQQ-dependent sugar dehydrogenase n=1 Tax=Schlesneria sp. TaxID=2762018 RepID=UPI002F0029C9